MEVNIQHQKISVAELGLSLEINPNHLVHKLMDEDGREMFRDMMFEKFDGILIQLVNDYQHIQNNVTAEIRQEIKDGKHIVSILQQFATFTRQIAPVCFSFEIEYYYDKMPKIKQEAIDWAYSTLYRRIDCASFSFKRSF
jgi:hypothetical protein